MRDSGAGLTRAGGGSVRFHAWNRCLYRVLTQCGFGSCRVVVVAMLVSFPVVVGGVPGPYDSPRPARVVPAEARRRPVLPSPGLLVRLSSSARRRRDELAHVLVNGPARRWTRMDDLWRRARSSCNNLPVPTRARRTRSRHRWRVGDAPAEDPAFAGAAAVRRTPRRVRHSIRKSLASSRDRLHCPPGVRCLLRMPM